MKINSINPKSFFKTLVIATPLLLSTPSLSATNRISYKNTHIREFDSSFASNLDSISVNRIKGSGLRNDTIELNPIEIVKKAPQVAIAGQIIYPTVVVDISENKLYYYNSEGLLEKEYRIATGKKSTPTKACIKKVMGVEKYPYTTAPKETKRNNTPDVYGARFISLGLIDEKTGEFAGFGRQFIHGTNESSSIGNYASQGCVRMHNKDVIELSALLKRGQFVLIQE